ncbi:glycosyltransferase family 2 protein [uncultured Robinsoniella sp.]|uniref:glycosyltransferase family 2 protein n=1 Tax=Robinsoniella sp. TaxID=2496533 RepID=UPI00374E9A48
MKISVVMATYNGEEYLLEQLKSLLNQSLKIDEVIIADDGSMDGTAVIINEFIRLNDLQDTWFFYQNSHNLGYADNFYYALQRAGGDIIFFCDQDDIWLEDKVHVMHDILNQKPQIQLLCSDYEPLVSSSNPPAVDKKTLRSMQNSGELEQIKLNRKNIHLGRLGCVMCIRKSFRDKIKPYWFSGWAHDEYVWKLAQCEDGCYIYHKPLILRRLHNHNVSMKKMHELDKRIRFLDLLLKSYKSAYRYVEQEKRSSRGLHMFQKNIKAAKLRVELLRDRKLLNSIRLVRYLGYYQYRRSILIEPCLLIKHSRIKGSG